MRVGRQACKGSAYSHRVDSGLRWRRLSKGHTTGVEAPAEQYDADGMILPEAAALHAVEWIEAGASVIGGCCGMGPAHISAIARAVKPR